MLSTTLAFIALLVVFLILSRLVYQAVPSEVRAYKELRPLLSDYFSNAAWREFKLDLKRKRVGYVLGWLLFPFAYILTVLFAPIRLLILALK